MEHEPLIYREEVTAILGALADLNFHVRRIYEMLREEFNGEEETEEGNS